MEVVERVVEHAPHQCIPERAVMDLVDIGELGGRRPRGRLQHHREAAPSVVDRLTATVVTFGPGSFSFGGTR